MNSLLLLSEQFCHPLPNELDHCALTHLLVKIIHLPVIIIYHLFSFSGANKQDEALECYGRAANLFKMAKKWGQAGQTFVTIATHHSKLGNKHDAATNYVDAANCYKKSDPKGN